MDASFNNTTSRTNASPAARPSQRRDADLAGLERTPRSPWGPIEQGQVKPLQAVSTLGERQALLLERAGITDTRLLWAADAPFLASIAGVRRETADDWRCTCELLAIRDLADRFAAPLVAAGVASIEDLCSETPTLLMGRLQRHPELHGDPSRRLVVLLSDVQEWIDAANRHKGWAPGPFPAPAATEV